MIELVNITKKYPGTVALDNVTVSFDKGRVHALIGKNGAGKSTLVKILAGVIKRTSGRILIDGKEVNFHSPGDAFKNGIASVHQELSLVGEMTVAENILLGRLPQRKILGKSVINWPSVFSKSQEVLDRLNISLDVRKKASELSVAQQQIVEIAKAMSFEPSALLFDEPTSALAHKETRQLFDFIKQLAKSGTVIIYITHRLGELCEIADTVTVLRDGRYIGTTEMDETTPRGIVEMMFGEIVQKQRPREVVACGESVMEVVNLSKKDEFSDINFTLRKGEVLGIAGMLGSGRTELLKAVFGAKPFETGLIKIKDQFVDSATPRKMKKLGLAFTSENRKEEGLILIHSIRNNMCMAGLDRLSVKGLITKTRENKAVYKLIDRLQIKVSDIEDAVESLSGGNQQKVAVGNWLNTRPDILLLDEPTRGIDVQAKQQIFQIIWDLSKEGISSIVVSSELEELIEVCHRILVMKNGRIINEVMPEDVSTDELFLMCMSSEKT